MSEWDCKHGNSEDLCPVCWREEKRDLEDDMAKFEQSNLRLHADIRALRARIKELELLLTRVMVAEGDCQMTLMVDIRYALKETDE